MHSSETINAISQAFSVLTMGINFQRLLGGLGVTVCIAMVPVFFLFVLDFLFGVLVT